MTAGAVHWVELPPSTGHEQSGRRPAIVVQDEKYAGTLPVVLTIPLTTTTSTLRFPGTVLCNPAMRTACSPPRSRSSFKRAP